MSQPFQPSQDRLNFDPLVNQLRTTVAQFPDSRSGDNTTYTMEDAGLTAFSVFFTQSPSWLDYQRRMESTDGISNVQTLFGPERIPTDNQVRNLLDPVPPSAVFPMFATIADNLHQLGHLDAYRQLGDQVLIGLDGTQYFSSNTIHCAQCNTTNHSNGTTTYTHTMVSPVIVAPDNAHVLPLEPEFVTPQDGHGKQDCENAAAKRWLAQYGPRYSAWGATLLGDDLYCKQPLCSAALEQGLNFLFVCKPDSHKELYEWLNGLQDGDGMQTLTVEWRKGKHRYTDYYRFANQLPLRDGEDALAVNWCELTTLRADGKQVYKNAFATNHAIDAANVAEIVRAGRARWKVENENNNTLKNRGYHLEHNFGHGKENLAATLATLNLLAFLFHTLLDLMDSKYQLVRSKLASRHTFFEHIRVLTCYHCFASFEAVLDFMIRSWNLRPPDTS